MKTFLGVLLAAAAASAAGQSLPAPAAVLAKLRRANAHFVAAWPDPGRTIVTNRERPSNIWTRAVYYEGLLALQAIDPHPDQLAYAVRWGEFHHWGMRSGAATRNADDQCCGQVYLALYQLDPRPERIRDIRASLEGMVASGRSDDWWWVDAIQMALPGFARLGAITGEAKYWEKGYALYATAKTRAAGHGLYDPAQHLWWRDKDFVPPYREPNGRDCFWSRGNGWVVAALVRVLEVSPAEAPHRAEYEQDLRDLLGAVVAVQRADGFWNCSLHDPGHFGGRETSGTALFAYGLAWGLRQRLLPEEKFRPALLKAWRGLAEDALHPDGFLGYVQGTGKEPKDGQPVTDDHAPDFTDYGLGCFLLAGTEVYRLARGDGPSVINSEAKKP